MMIGAIRRKLNGGIDFAAALEKAERDIYVKAYKYHKHNQTLSAKSLGVARGTFLTKMKHWGELK